MKKVLNTRMFNSLIKYNVFEGFWWLPDFPEEKIPGIARYENNKEIIVKLFGRFTNTPQEEKIPVLIGQLEDDFKISLFDVQIQPNTYYQKDDNGINATSIAICYEFIEGYHLLKLSDNDILKIEFSLPNLTNWFGANLQPDIDQITCPKFDKINNCSYETNIKLNNDIMLQFRSFLTTITTNFTEKQSVIESKICFIFANKTNLQVCTQLLNKFLTFYSFAIQRKVFYKNLIIYFGKDHNVKANYIFPNRGENIEHENILNCNMFLKYEDVHHRITDILNTWLFDSDEYGLAFELYFAMLYNNHLYLENEFNTYILAVESILSKRCKYKTLICEDDFNNQIRIPIQEQINLLSVEKYLKNKLKNSLGNTNKKSLNDLLKEFITSYPDEMQAIILNENKLNEFTRDIVNLRNYYAHLFHSKDELFTSSEGLYYYTRKIKLLLQLLLLQIMGIENNEVINLRFDSSY